MPDELEPLRGAYDWDRAFAQNPGEAMYEVTPEQRRRVHHLPPAARPSTRPVIGLRQLIHAAPGHTAAVLACVALGLTGFTATPSAAQQNAKAPIVHTCRRRPVRAESSAIRLVSHVLSTRGALAA